MGRSTYFQAGFFAFLASGGFGVPSYWGNVKDHSKTIENIAPLDQAPSIYMYCAASSVDS